MNDEFLDYYRRELDFIREMGAEFATAHPQEASQLLIDAKRCEDPHVERLLEAFAFLTAKIRKKIDDEYPEVTDALLSVVYPHFQRPIPSMTIVQFEPPTDASKIAGGPVIERGVGLVTPPVSGTRCRFRTSYPVTLWPVSVDAAALSPDRVAIADRPRDAVALLRLTLRCSAPGGWAALSGFESLRFFLGGDESVASLLHESLFNDVAGVRLRGQVAGSEESVDLGVGAIRPVGYSADEAMLPYTSRSFPGYRLLQEFFAFPSKFLFFDLSGLDAIPGMKFDGPVEVLFFLRRPPGTEVVIRPDNFRLGCTPAVNLFEVGAEPIALSGLKSAYPVVPKWGELDGHEVYSVDKVTNFDSYMEGLVEFQPFHATRHGSAGVRRDAFWHATRRPSMRENDEGTEVELAFTDPEFSPTTPSVERISARITCTNRDLPAHLPFGGNTFDFDLEAAAPVGRVRPLTRPSKSLRPPLGRSAQWALISQLGLNHLSLIESGTGASSLRDLLAIFDFARGAASRKMIEGVVDVRSDRIAARVERRNNAGRRLGNPVCLGMEVTVRFDEDGYAGSGAFLMASILERFLGAYATINSFTQMVATSKQREGTWKRWPPRCGDRTLL